MAKSNAFSQPLGWIEFICGPMFAGKSEELLRKVNRMRYADVDFLIFKPKIDTRSGSKAKSRDGRELNAIDISDSYEIFDYVLKQEIKPQIIAIDEVQFCDNNLVDVVQTLANSGINIILAGLDRNFKGEPFGPVPELIACSDSVMKLTAICTTCGAVATRTQRIINGIPADYDSPTIFVNTDETYTARCRQHHEVPNKPISTKSHDFMKDLKHKK